MASEPETPTQTKLTGLERSSVSSLSWFDYQTIRTHVKSDIFKHEIQILVVKEATTAPITSQVV